MTNLGVLDTSGSPPLAWTPELDAASMGNNDSGADAFKSLLLHQVPTPTSSQHPLRSCCAQSCSHRAKAVAHRRDDLSGTDIAQAAGKDDVATIRLLGPQFLHAVDGQGHTALHVSLPFLLTALTRCSDRGRVTKSEGRGAGCVGTREHRSSQGAGRVGCIGGSASVLVRET